MFSPNSFFTYEILTTLRDRWVVASALPANTGLDGEPGVFTTQFSGLTPYQLRIEFRLPTTECRGRRSCQACHVTEALQSDVVRVFLPVNKTMKEIREAERPPYMIVRWNRHYSRPFLNIFHQYLFFAPHGEKIAKEKEALLFFFRLHFHPATK